MCTKFWLEKVKKEEKKIDLKKTGWEDVDWNHAAQAGTAGGLLRTGNKPSSFIKGRKIFDYLSDY
jgi:hypothetical protein